MSAWYEESFGSHYLEVYAHRDGREAEDDARAIITLINPDRDAPLLDLGCGSGRHLAALHRLGFRFLVGLDLSAELLGEAARNLPRGDGGRVMLVRGDMREIPHHQCFATVLSFFTTFGYFEEDNDNARIVHAVHRVLRRGGVFVLDYINRNRLITDFVPEDEQDLPGMHVRNVRSLTEGGRRVEKRITVERVGMEPVTLFESVRLFTREEITDMFAIAGLGNIRCFGSLAGDPHRPDSERLVVVGERVS